MIMDFSLYFNGSQIESLNPFVVTVLPDMLGIMLSSIISIIILLVTFGAVYVVTGGWR